MAEVLTIHNSPNGGGILEVRLLGDGTASFTVQETGLYGGATISSDDAALLGAFLSSHAKVAHRREMRL